MAPKLTAVQKRDLSLLRRQSRRAAIITIRAAVREMDWAIKFAADAGDPQLYLAATAMKERALRG